jgi:hypothetical protein
LNKLILLSTLAIVSVFGQAQIDGLTARGTVNMSAATTTKPMKSGTSLPGTCSVGEFYNKTDATNTAVIYACTATNTWTAQGGSGSFTVASEAEIAAATDNTKGITPARLKYGLQNLVTTAQGIQLTPTATGLQVDTDSTIPIKITSGTIVVNPGSIASGACSSAITATATGLLTTDVIDIGFNGDPTAVVGIDPAGDQVQYIPYPTADTVNVKVCNKSGSAVDPGTLTLNWVVRR